MHVQACEGNMRSVSGGLDHEFNGGDVAALAGEKEGGGGRNDHLYV